MDTSTQCQVILSHLMTHGSITSYEAMVDYRIMRLASRIHDLKRKGYNIQSSRETSQDETGKEVMHWSRYYLVGETA